MPDRRRNPTSGTGAIVNVAPVSPLPRTGWRWNAMTIRAQGARFELVLNGRQQSPANSLATVHG